MTKNLTKGKSHWDERWVGKLLVGILISIIAWASTNIYLYYNNRWKIEEVMLLAISMYSHKLQEIQDFCNKYMETQINKNTIISNTMRYSKDEFDFYKLMVPDIIKYLSKGNILKIMKYYNALIEYNFLMEGLCKEIDNIKDKHIILKLDDLNYIKTKNDRINKIVKLITQRQYKIIEDLPDDYRGMVPPETLVK